MKYEIIKDQFSIFFIKFLIDFYYHVLFIINQKIFFQVFVPKVLMDYDVAFHPFHDLI